MRPDSTIVWGLVASRAGAEIGGGGVWEPESRVSGLDGVS